MLKSDGLTKAGVTVRPVDGWWDRHRFIRFPHTLYGDDSQFRAPPDLLVAQDLSPSSNPWFEHGEAQLFLAERDGAVVGRISAQVDHRHLEYHDDGAGFFGYFECEDDHGTAEALLEAAADWVEERGQTRMRGPFNFSINGESGLLVDGFDDPNYVMMPHGRPCYDGLMKSAGFEQAKDLYAWRFERQEMPETPREIAEDMRDHPGLEIRSIDLDNLERDINIIIDVFNAGWSDNWGFVPMTEAEIAHLAEQFKWVVDPDLCMIARYEGEVAGMALGIPNLHEVFRDFEGRLFPFNWAKALYRLKIDQLRSFRLILMGLKPKFRGTALGALSVLMYATIHDRAYAKGYEEAEASWTLKDNDAINRGMEFMGASHYKTYRLYETAFE
jgi:GNAT superfamily N-acetyltransferase